ncbi:hypothetical protein ZOD2009_11955 [Haladaptatus paucihalophilus DX253]|uniref:Uncharacterized protein n=1 Tax=Haladaptatus paucihalophilus DX253 TaxID=797209 RepID=E7QUB1_HALPU|nr:hypothetical protein ZOD2009_11955 [Haladaptatus paucihalophilus DX253]
MVEKDVLKRCVECGEKLLEIYVEDERCPDCRDE